MLSVDTTVSFPLLAFLNQMAPIARFIDNFVPLLHAQQEHISGGRYPIDVTVYAKSDSHVLKGTVTLHLTRQRAESCDPCACGNLSSRLLVCGLAGTRWSEKDRDLGQTSPSSFRGIYNLLLTPVL